MFGRCFDCRLTSSVIAKGVTAAQAYFLVGEVLGRSCLPEYAEEVTVEADGGRGAVLQGPGGG